MRRFGRFLLRRRSVPRTAAAVVVTLAWAGGEYSPRLTDVSRTGARLSGPKLPAQDEVVFRAEGYTGRCSGRLVGR